MNITILAGPNITSKLKVMVIEKATESRGGKVSLGHLQPLKKNPLAYLVLFVNSTELHEGLGAAWGNLVSD